MAVFLYCIHVPDLPVVYTPFSSLEESRHSQINAALCMPIDVTAYYNISPPIHLTIPIPCTSVTSHQLRHIIHNKRRCPLISHLPLTTNHTPLSASLPGIRTDVQHHTHDSSAIERLRRELFLLPQLFWGGFWGACFVHVSGWGCGCGQGWG